MTLVYNHVFPRDLGKILPVVHNKLISRHDNREIDLRFGRFFELETRRAKLFPLGGWAVVHNDRNGRGESSCLLEERSKGAIPERTNLSNSLTQLASCIRKCN
jgi:hypothetical protein